MFTIFRNVADHHDGTLVGIAVLVCLFGGYTLFAIAGHSGRVSATVRLFWLAMGGVAGGTTIWATHFIAMLAYHDGMPAQYAAGPTATSAIVAVLGTTLALLIGRTLDGIWTKPLAGVTLAGAITTMHFLGMHAMSTDGFMHYDRGIVAWSIGLGTLFAILSVMASSNLHRPIARKGLATLFFVLSIATIHFGSMAAMRMEMPAGAMMAKGADQTALAAAVTFGVLTVIGISLLSERFASHQIRRDIEEADRLRSLADISLEGLMVLDTRDMVIDANRRMEMFYRRPVTGLHISQILPDVPIAFFAEDQVRDPIGTRLLRADEPDMPIEVLVHRTTHMRRLARVVAVRDLTERVEAEKRIRYVANHDALTGLPNRLLFMDRLEQAIARTRRTGAKAALLYIDLDGFKSVNDVFGHAKGDEVLCGVSALMTNILRSGDTLARLGGDEFAIVQCDCAQPGGAEVLARRLTAEIERVYGTAQGDVSLGASIGIAIAPDDAIDASMLVRNADIALYKAKDSGRGTWQFFETEMDRALRERHLIESELRQALDAGEIFLAYQPQMNADTGEITGFEALVRWQHPRQGLIAPDVFIPIAEQSGFIVPLGAWVLREACSEAARWANPLRIAVNLSPVQFQQGALTKRVKAILSETGLEPSRLELEITESALMRDRDATIAALDELKAYGIRIAMDDFGTGYSSLSNLQSFPFDKIKVDRSFVSMIEDDEKASSIVKAIIGLGHSLALPIVAEGVESHEQLNRLRLERCTEIQGFLVSRPLPIATFEHIVGTKHPHSATRAA
jgi:diguanylate cyclase (GGDEF)-like protein